jgi:hypothetical protein
MEVPVNVAGMWPVSSDVGVGVIVAVGVGRVRRDLVTFCLRRHSTDLWPLVALSEAFERWKRSMSEGGNRKARIAAS